MILGNHILLVFGYPSLEIGGVKISSAQKMIRPKNGGYTCHIDPPLPVFLAPSLSLQSGQTLGALCTKCKKALVPYYSE